MNIGIQGIKGAFHEEAALKHFGTQVQIFPYLTFSSLVESIRLGEITSGMMAVENTISGTIHDNLQLIRESGLHITGEQYLRISQNLAVLPGTSLDMLREVSSHYMAINQCREFFRSHPGIKLVEVEDTALAMRAISQDRDPRKGALGSSQAASHYGLQIIASGIETHKKNYTRFLVLEKDAPATREFNKASVSVTLKNKKGGLSQILSIMAFYDLDLSKIESMPIIGEPWHYRFYIDMLFDNTDAYQHAMSAIRPLLDDITILGEYNSGIDSLNQLHDLS